MNIELELISPEIASEMLSGNDRNRRLNPNHVKFLTDQIINDCWQITGDPVKLNTEGVLLDGQHRLSAIIKAGKAVNVFVARDVPDKVFTVLDTGKNRSGGDTLAIAGLKSATSQSALARAIMAYDDKRVNNKSRIYTNKETLEFCQTFDLLPFVNLGVVYGSKGSPVKAGVISIIYFILARIDKKEAESFLEALCLGVGIQKGSALYVIREKLNKAILHRYEYSRWETIALVIKTWNIMRAGRPVPSMIIYNPEREECPIAI